MIIDEMLDDGVDPDTGCVMWIALGAATVLLLGVIALGLYGLARAVLAVAP
jgi:hypothetical protein